MSISKKHDQRFWNANQSWHYEAIWNVSGRVVRVRVRRNAYDDQSNERVELFDSDKWNALVEWPIDERLKDIPYFKPLSKESKDAFYLVECDLIAHVNLILRLNAGKK